MTLQEFNSLIACDKPVVAVFHATSWCRPCKETVPLVKKAAKELSDKIEFLFIDINEDYKENEEIIDVFNIYFVPTLLLFTHGELADRHTGAMTAEDINKLFDNWLNK